MNPPRILLNEVGSSPGSGAAPPANSTPAPAPAPAPSPAQPQQLSAEATKAIADQVRDGVFAELRRSGVLTEKKAQTKAPENGTSPNAPPAMDPSKLRALDRAVARAGHADRISSAAYERLERAFVAEAPEDTEAWVKEYFSAFTGPAQPAQSQPTTAPTGTPPAPTNQRPDSDRGGTPPPKVPAEEADLVKMSDADRAAIIKEKGLSWYRTQLAKQLKGRPITFRR